MRAIALTLADETATASLARRIAQTCQPGSLIWLEGELAAGKTFFCRAFLHALGHQGKVKSPTFTVVESYLLPGGCTVHHFDLYRLSDPDELHYLGFDDYLDRKAICLIEWASRLEGALPPFDLRLSFYYLDVNVRKIVAETSDPVLLKLLEESAESFARSGN